MKKLRINLFCALLSVSIGTIFSQITIGSSESPLKGALLDLKQYSSLTLGGTTADKGLLLPRVELQSLKLDGSTYTDLSQTIKEGTGSWSADMHTGLTVYNLATKEGICPGVYIWTGELWNKLGQQCFEPFSLYLDKSGPLYFTSGLTGSVIEASNLLVTWNPITAVVTSTNGASGSYSPLAFTTNSIPTTLSGTGSQTLTIKPDPMIDTEIASNLFATKESELKLTATDGTNTITKSIILNQTNKAIKVNNTLYPQPIHSSITDKMSITSNAKFNVTATPISGTTPVNIINGLNRGSERYDNSANPDEIVNFNTAGSDARYSLLTISDANNPKRFDDVFVNVTMCDIKTDFTMEQYKDLWEEMYGLYPNIDEDGSDGDITKNTNRVQWHYDQDQNIFFSAMFGNDRWMITNLAATKYADGTPITHSITPSTTDAEYVYPKGGTAPNTSSEYDKFQRMGLLYNHYATIRGAIATSDQGGQYHANIQGVCPNGWHVGRDIDWTNLVTTINGDLPKYTTNTSNLDPAYSVKDPCETEIGTGLSRDILHGGFSVVFTGWAAVSEIIDKETAVFWTSSTATNSAGVATASYKREITSTTKLLDTIKAAPNGFLSVRCIAD